MFPFSWKYEKRNWFRNSIDGFLHLSWKMSMELFYKRSRFISKWKGSMRLRTWTCLNKNLLGVLCGQAAKLKGFWILCPALRCNLEALRKYWDRPIRWFVWPENLIPLPARRRPAPLPPRGRVLLSRPVNRLERLRRSWGRFSTAQ